MNLFSDVKKKGKKAKWGFKAMMAREMDEEKKKKKQKIIGKYL